MAIPSSSLLDRVQDLPGVGQYRARTLTRLGIRRALDLLFYFPRSYQDVAPILTVDQFVENVRVSFAGTIVEIGERVTQSGKHMLGVEVRPDGGGSIRLLWFNQPYRKNELRVGLRVLATGNPRSTVLNWEMVQPQVLVLAGEEAADSRQPMPVYALTEGIKQTAMRAMMQQALPPLIGQVEEALPDSMRERLEVADIHTALHDIHFPKTMEAALAAQRRFKLQELLVLQLAIALQRQSRERAALAPKCEPTGKIHARILNRFPHQPTADQLTAIEEVGQDMAREQPMNRLLQGDVGSGKTLVAQYAMLLCVAHGYQAALMAPTEILARQHAATLEKSLQASRVRIELFTGSLTLSQRAAALARIAAGEVDLVVGTQALLSEDLEFHGLALVIVDEQHKFGVLQRAQLRTETSQPHYLVLSATPIPRTIAMTAFGDLDVSTIRTRPPGRAAVHTYSSTRENLPSWWKFVDEQIQQGRQAYVIAPRVAEAEDAGCASAEGIYAELTEGAFQHRRVGLLHGRLTSQEKEEVLRQFVEHDLDILVATTVVEVGIDVPNATVMSILDADRLGLSQLHQLRGRISRGSHAGFVCAIASTGCDSAENERLKAFEKSSDGFELSEMDLKIRGPGDLLGTSQSGLPTLRVANLVEDAELLERARFFAREILAEDPELSDPKLARLVKQTLHRYGKSMQLSDVG